jgi:hypothetical protein
MKLVYQELPDYQFAYWIDEQIMLNQDDLNKYMDINQWCGQQFGELGSTWGYERKTITQPHPPGLNPVKIKLFYTFINHSWRFKNKSDAMAFKLAWGGA